MSDLTIDEGAIASRDEWLAAGSSGAYFMARPAAGYNSRWRFIPRDARQDRDQWLESVRDQILDSLALEENWDSFGSPSPDVRAAKRAGSLMEWAANTSFVLPVPRTEGTSEGGLSIEWFEPHTQLNFVIDGSGREVVVFFKDRTTGEIWEGPIESASEVVRSAFSRLSS